MARGQRLGENLELKECEEKSIQVNQDDLLFLYTDGIMEGTNTEGAQFGKKSVRKIVQSHVNHKPKEIIDALMKDFRSHNGTKPFDDDVTLAVARIHGSGIS